MNITATISVPAQDVKVAAEVDVCVIGGSCTGVFAAIAAGRLVDADRGAYGAVRVMVNTNQTGQAAGVAAYLALQEGCLITELDAVRVRALLAGQGAIVI